MLVESASWSQWQMMALSSTICFLNKTTHEPIGTNILKSDSAALALTYRTSEKGKWLSLLIDFRKQGSNKKHKNKETKQVIHRNHFILKETWLDPTRSFTYFCARSPKKSCARTGQCVSSSRSGNREQCPEKASLLFSSNKDASKQDHILLCSWTS